MKNSTNIKIAKKYEPMVKEIYHDSDGYWVYTAEGYYAAGMGCCDECHTIHEDTVKELLWQIRQIKKLREEII